MTSSQHRSHFFLHVNGRPHTTQIFSGKFVLEGLLSTFPFALPPNNWEENGLTREGVTKALVLETDRATTTTAQTETHLIEGLATLLVNIACVLVSRIVGVLIVLGRSAIAETSVSECVKRKNYKNEKLGCELSRPFSRTEFVRRLPL